MGPVFVYIWYIFGTWWVRGWYVVGTWLVRGGYVVGTWLVRGFDPNCRNKGPMTIVPTVGLIWTGGASLIALLLVQSSYPQLAFVPDAPS